MLVASATAGRRVCTRNGSHVAKRQMSKRLRTPISTLPRFKDPAEDALKVAASRTHLPLAERTHLSLSRKRPKDSWLAARVNDGHGSRSMQLQNFHWKVKNAFDLDSLKEFQGHIGRLEQSNFNVIAVFRAADGLDFCPGADLKRMKREGTEYRREFYKASQETAYLLATMKTPAFACMQGLTMGLGAGLTGHSLFRVVTGDVQWSVPNVLYGAIPDCGMSYRLSRLDGELGMFLALTGKRLDSTDIIRAGLATHYITQDSLTRFEQETGKIISQDLKELFIFLDYHIRDDINKIQESAIEKHLEEIDRVFSKPTLKGVFQQLEAEKTPWADGILERLKSISPLMLHVVFRLMKVARYLNTLEEALELEYRIMQHVITHPDFEAGLTRLNNRTPIQWMHANIDEVTNEEVNAFFKPTEYDLDLKLSDVSAAPAKDPFRVYVDQIAAMYEDPLGDPLMDIAMDQLFPEGATRGTRALRAAYTELMKSGGIDEEAARYYFKMDYFEKKSHWPMLSREFLEPQRDFIQEEEDYQEARRDYTSPRAPPPILEEPKLWMPAHEKEKG